MVMDPSLRRNLSSEIFPRVYFSLPNEIERIVSSSPVEKTLSVDLFPSKTEGSAGGFSWSIQMSKGVASQSLTLKISSIGGSHFKVSLCENLLSETLEFPFLRFHLCSEDAQHLHDTPQFRKRLPSGGTEKLEKFLESKQVIPRRTHALIGQIMLQNYYSVQCDWVYFGVAKGDGRFAADQMVELNNRMLMWDVDELPENFDDLEDDDHDGDDEEMRELSDEDYVD